MPAASEYTIHLPASVDIGLSSSGGLCIAESERLLLGAYLPEVEVAPGISSEVDFTIQHVESDESGVRQGKDELELKDAWRDQFPADLPHLLYGIARSCWLQKELFSVHAACLQRPDGLTTVLPGHSGTGKSTVALELAAAHGQKIISGNTTLVGFTDDGPVPLAGTHTMTLSTPDFQARDIEAHDAVEYGDRTAFRLAPERHTLDDPSVIGRIGLLRISDTKQQRQTLEPLSALHRLYPYFLDTVHQDVVVCNGEALYAGETPPQSRHFLLQALRKSLQYTPVQQLTGTSRQLAEMVAS